MPYWLAEYGVAVLWCATLYLVFLIAVILLRLGVLGLRWLLIPAASLKTPGARSAGRAG